MKRRDFNETLVFQGPVPGNEPEKTEKWAEIKRTQLFYHRTQGVKCFKKEGNVKCRILKMT